MYFPDGTVRYIYIYLVYNIYIYLYICQTGPKNGGCASSTSCSSGCACFVVRVVDCHVAVLLAVLWSTWFEVDVVGGGDGGWWFVGHVR